MMPPASATQSIASASDVAPINRAQSDHSRKAAFLPRAIAAIESLTFMDAPAPLTNQEGPRQSKLDWILAVPPS